MKKIKKSNLLNVKGISRNADFCSASVTKIALS